MDSVVLIGVILAIAVFVVILKNRPENKHAHKPKGQHADAVYSQDRTPAQRMAERDMNSGFRNVHGTSSFDDDEGLATFRINYGQSEPGSTNKTPGRWIMPGTAIKVGGKVIDCGFFYFGGNLRAVERFGGESALIDDSLPVVPRDVSYSDVSLGYYPKYISLSPKCRGAFLEWLSSGRNDPSTPLGYVFLYFYGLERRIVHDARKKDAVTDEEYTAIGQEIRRLLSVYGRNPAFSGYAFRLLEWMKLFRPGTVSITNDEIRQHNLSLLFSILAGKTVNYGQPIPAEMAHIWLNFSNFIPKTPARRCPEEFKTLFCKLYQDKYGEGMKIKPNKTFVKPTYHPASSSLTHTIMKATTLPNPTVLGSVASKLIFLANTASHKLDPYSRYLGKPHTSAHDLEATLLLPKELSGESAGANLFPVFSRWASGVIAEQEGLVTFAEFWNQLTDTPAEKITKKELDIAQGVLDRTGFGMAPDPRFHHAKPTADGSIVLFHGGHGDLQQPSNTFNETGMALRLGAMVAKIDGHAHDAEIQVLKSLIDHNENLSATARKSLHAYLLWRLNSPQNNASLKKQIENLSDQAKKGISKILISVAMADGRISPDEIKQMEKLYTSLGLDKSIVTSDIHGLTTTRAPETSEKAVAKPAGPPSGFSLDESVLALHESETKDVQGILGSIFTEDEPEDELTGTSDEPVAPVEEAQDDDGLDPAHRRLVDQLITREKWTREEFEGLCDTFGLMADGALETINDWSFDKVDDPLLEDDNDIYVMLDIAEEIANL